MSIKKHGSAKWTGNLKEGKGHVSTQTGVLNDQPYGFQTRFEGKSGTNPEELIGAAHASCFSMALSMILEGEDLVADSIETKATVHLEQKDGG
ncbi:OsmC family peroxiredoxin, partial [Sulfitobacter sp. HI0129]